MANTIEGKLVWQGQGKDRKRRVVWRARKGGMTIPTPFPEAELAAELRSREEDEIDIELELDKGRPCRIRLQGQAWQVPAASAKPPPVGRPRPAPERRGSPPVTYTPAFHNPYNFVPAWPRDPETVELSELGDRQPVGHDRYFPDYYSGRLRVRLTTETPLLLMDTAHPTRHEDDHKSFPVRLDQDGKPAIAPTSLKGMLRSSYEAVTNSRLSVFAKHDDRLAYRLPARLGPVPARVECDAQGALVLRVMRADLMGHAAKLPRYRLGRQVGPDKGEQAEALRYPSNALPQHGDAVWVEVDPKGRVHRIEPRQPGQTRPVQASSARTPGWVCVTGPNINGKRYERVFIEGASDARLRVEEAHRKLWWELITNYQSTHKSELEARQKNRLKPEAYLGNEPGKTGWSRHVYTPEAATLSEGTLCYVELNRQDDPDSGIKALLPVTISRRLFDVSPAAMLPTSLQPATDPTKLSPADRVFGWVNGQGAGAHRSQLRISSVQCCSEEAVEAFGDPGLPVAILGQPKPQQSRFYVAVDKTGQAQAASLPPSQTGYRHHCQGLRGRKVYPHHRGLPEGYWDDPMQDRTQERRQAPFYQDYRRPRKRDERGVPQEQRDNQNRSVQGWVKAQTVFEFEVQVTNLSAVELGALVWLLQLPPGQMHRLGGGKPLGFGSVRLDVVEEACDVRLGSAWQDHYRTFAPTPRQSGFSACVEAYRSAVVQSYQPDGAFDDVPFIKAFRRAAAGFEDGLPVHYPRTRPEGATQHPAPHPEGETFKWFVENARQNAPKYPLPDLASGLGLPLLEERRRAQGQRR